MRVRLRKWRRSPTFRPGSHRDVVAAMGLAGLVSSSIAIRSGDGVRINTPSDANMRATKT
jgi:hypothetical protein